MNDVSRCLGFSRCETASGVPARLLIPDPIPLHSLWIADHLHLILAGAEEVTILSDVRALFEAHPDCRKGADVAAFLHRNSPPIRYLDDTPGALEGYLNKPVETLILTGESEKWTAVAMLPQIDILTTSEFIASAEKTGLVADSFPLMQSFRLPGEITEAA